MPEENIYRDLEGIEVHHGVCKVTVPVDDCDTPYSFRSSRFGTGFASGDSYALTAPGELEFETRPDWGASRDNPPVVGHNSLIRSLPTRFEPPVAAGLTCEESSKRIHGGPFEALELYVRACQKAGVMTLAEK